jgi:transposase InsO family protein
VQLHRNAKTTPKGRAVLVARVRTQHWTVRQAAAASGVSVRTAYKWLARFRDAGVSGLEDRGSQPRRCPHRTAPSRETQIVALRAARLSGPAIAWRMGVARATVGNVLRRHGLGRLPPLRPRPLVQRYERARPGELVHIDTKILGRIGAVGHRITGRLQDRVRGVGWEHVHVAVDDRSRLAYVEVLPTQQKHDAAAFVARALAWFRRRGVQVEQLMTDNAWAYRSLPFLAVCRAHGLRHLRTRPYTPRTNGKAERFIQTMLREWAYAHPYPSSAARHRALRPWLGYYNGRRPHTALGHRPPISRLYPSVA